MTSNVQSAPKLHNPYTRVSRSVPALSACPVCGCAGEAWRYQQEPDTLPTVVIMCSNTDAFAADECGCLLSVPPSCFFLSTLREAADYWNGYAAWVLEQRAARGTTDANAPLLAAAPELLEALTRICSDPELSDSEDSIATLCWEDVVAARAAIARAKGEPA